MEVAIANLFAVVQQEMAHNNNTNNQNNTEIITLDLKWKEIDLPHNNDLFSTVILSFSRSTSLFPSLTLSLSLSHPLFPSLTLSLSLSHPLSFPLSRFLPPFLLLTLCLHPYLCMCVCLCVWKYLSLERVWRLSYIVTDYQLSTAAGICWMSLST